VQILSDNTVDTAGVLLNAHAPQVGGSWIKNTVTTGTAGISSANRIRQLTTTSPIYYVSNVPAGPDQVMAADMFIASITTTTGEMGPSLRLDTAADTSYISGYRGSTLSWVIAKSVAGKGTILASAAATLTVGNTYTLTFSIVGSALTLLVNGVSTVTATDSTITAAGRVGVRFGAGAATDTTSYHLTNLSADDGAMQPNEYQTRQNFTVYRM